MTRKRLWQNFLNYILVGGGDRKSLMPFLVSSTDKELGQEVLDICSMRPIVCCYYSALPSSSIVPWR